MFMFCRLIFIEVICDLTTSLPHTSIQYNNNISRHDRGNGSGGVFALPWLIRG